MTRPTERHVAASGDVPAYTVRVSERAKNVRLTVTPRDGLVVTVPSTMPDFDPASVLRERHDWIEASSARFAQRRAELLGPPSGLLPREVRLAFSGERWPVEYRASSSASVRARAPGDVLVVSGAVGDADACLAALRRWLQSAARVRLLPAFWKLAADAGLSPALVRIRGQRARWGGCSPSGTVTLNRALLFLPPELVRAAMLHELAHLCVGNHSAAFWAELDALDNRSVEHAAAIAASWDAVPPWAEP